MAIVSVTSWRKIDWILILTTFILSLIGLATIYSVDLSQGKEPAFFSTQITAIAISTILLIIAYCMQVSFYESLAKIAYILAFLLLIGVLVFGENIRGTTGWFRVAGFSFQPTEFAKLALIIFLAWRIERQARHFDKWQFVVATGIMTGLLVFLILLQPDLGSAFILFSIWFGLLVLVNTKKRYIIGIIALGLISFIISWFFIFETYQKERLSTFIHPNKDPLGAGYNVNQSIIAIGSGNLLGRGLGFGSQSQLHFLPEAQTDFIFSVIGEDLGLIGVLIVIALYVVLLWRLIRIAGKCRNDFSAYLVLGIALMFFLQIIVNIGGGLGLLPVTGITLPFVSYGGSSLIINFMLVGIALSASKSL